MSQANVEIVRAIYEAAERRDWDRAFRDQHPDVELTAPPGIDAGTYRGRTEIQRFWEDWFTVCEERSSAHPEQFIEIENRNGHLWSIRNGEVVSMRMFPSPDEALEAAGLPE
ncbi:MAG TPA: nuclear transport factor 2 family protein [Thermoanaerobaculia bacterium]